MLKILAAILGFSTPADVGSADRLSDRHIVEVVRDLSNDGKVNVITNHSVFSADDAGDGKSPDEHVFSTIAGNLEKSGRMISLDWKEELTECQAAFTALFAKAGIDTSGASGLIASAKPFADGSDVGATYVAFRQLADKANMRIVGLNADSDMYHFALTTPDRADRWLSVAIGPNQYIEDSDWQFLAIFKALGIAPRSTEGPSHTLRPAPTIRP